MTLRVWITVLWVGSIAVVGGCSGKSPPAAAPGAAPVTVAAPAPGIAPAAADTSTMAQPVNSAHPETKWIGKIPYDAFYDHPLDVAKDNTPVNGGGTGNPTAPGEDATSVTPSPVDTHPAPADAAVKAAEGKTDWGKVIPLELALEAVKVARSEVNANLQTVPKYNAGMESIRSDAALIGMLAMIVAEHPEAANWKAKAKYIRDLSYEIQGKATEKGSGPKEATSQLFEQITAILDGGQPPEKESKDSVPYVEVADRSEMMKIIDKTMNDLKSNIGDPKRMKEQASEVTRQLSVLHALGVMMSDSSYDAADNPEYQGYAKAFINGASLGVEAVKSDKFDEFQGALNKLNNSCNECHPKFRSQDNGN